MNTQITTAMLVSVSLILAALFAVPAMNYAVYAGDKDDDDDDDDDDDNGHKECKLPNGNPYPGNRDSCPPGLDR
jgi:hypothetical protein